MMLYGYVDSLGVADTFLTPLFTSNWNNNLFTQKLRGDKIVGFQESSPSEEVPTIAKASELQSYQIGDSAVFIVRIDDRIRVFDKKSLRYFFETNLDELKCRPALFYNFVKLCGKWNFYNESVDRLFDSIALQFGITAAQRWLESQSLELEIEIYFREFLGDHGIFYQLSRKHAFLRTDNEPDRGYVNPTDGLTLYGVGLIYPSILPETTHDEIRSDIKKIISKRVANVRLEVEFKDADTREDDNLSVERFRQADLFNEYCFYVSRRLNIVLRLLRATSVDDAVYYSVQLGGYRKFQKRELMYLLDAFQHNESVTQATSSYEVQRLQERVRRLAKGMQVSL